MKKLFLILISLSVLSASCNSAVAPTNDSPAPVSTFENEYLKNSLPDGWNAYAVSSNPAAVNITKGKYIIYINTRATQASGVEGGRFAEIAMGAPSADAVVTVQPSPPCGDSKQTKVLDAYSRTDLYVNKLDNKEYCSGPENDKTVWYFSYISKDQGYFIHTWNNRPTNLVITMAYNSKNISDFPTEDSPELSEAFASITEMIGSLELK
jgi:hypothetical protein